MAIDAVYSHVKGSAEKTFQVSTLENIYLEKLEHFGIHKSSHTTRFAEKLLEFDCGVLPVQKKEGSQHVAIKKDSFHDVVHSPVEWFHLLRKVVDPIKSEIQAIKDSATFDALPLAQK